MEHRATIIVSGPNSQGQVEDVKDLLRWLDECCTGEDCPHTVEAKITGRAESGILMTERLMGRFVDD